MTKDKKDIDNNLIQNREEEIKNILFSNGISDTEYENALNRRIEKFPYNSRSLLTVVSGKDFLIPCIVYELKKRFHLFPNIPRRTWKYHMAKYCSLERLSDLKEVIIS